MENLSASYSSAGIPIYDQHVISFDQATNEIKLEFSDQNDNFDIVPTVAPY